MTTDNVASVRNGWRDALDTAEDVPVQARMVAWILHRFANADPENPDPRCERVWVEVGTGVRMSGLSRTRWYSWLDWLAERGWLAVTEPGRRGAAARAARYRLVIPHSSDSPVSGTNGTAGESDSPVSGTLLVPSAGQPLSRQRDGSQTEPRQDSDPPVEPVAEPAVAEDDERVNAEPVDYTDPGNRWTHAAVAALAYEWQAHPYNVARFLTDACRGREQPFRSRDALDKWLGGKRPARGAGLRAGRDFAPSVELSRLQTEYDREVIDDHGHVRVDSTETRRRFQQLHDRIADDRRAEIAAVLGDTTEVAA